MSQRNNTRVTIDVPTISHKRLKMFAAYYGKSMRDIFNEIIEDGLDRYEEEYEECRKSHEPNEATKQSLENAKKRKGLKKYASVEELFKKLSE
jgi:hypothetical protein